MSDLDPSTASVAVSDRPNSEPAPTKKRKARVEKPPLSAHQAGQVARRKPKGPQR